MEFTEYKIGDIASIKYGKMLSKEHFMNEGYPVYSGYGVTGYTDKYLYENPMLIIVARGVGGTGDVKISPSKSWITNLSLVLDVDESVVDKRYLKHLLNLDDLKGKLNTGSAQAQITINSLEPYKVNLPDLDSQKVVSNTIEYFDDLIENNARRIAILEEMARLIYREWFVHYRYPGHENDRLVDSGTELGDLPEGWKVKSLVEVADLNPENISKDYKGNIEYINISGVDIGKINETEHYDIEDAPGRAKRKVNHGDIIWSSVRPNLKSYALIMNPKPNWIASTGFAVIRPFKLPSSFLYNFVTTDYFVEYLINHARGSAYPAVNVSDFKNAKIVVPPDDLIKKYDGVVWPNFQQIDRIEWKNKKLKETRDLLLPKLISGKIEINNITLN